LEDILGYNPRICNSDDAGDTSYCQEAALNYTEVRIHNSNWESSIFFSWILQIWLSERLGVPVTVGLNAENAPLTSFYNQDMASLQYSPEAYPFDALKEANSVEDCRLSDKDCAHVMPEVWNGQVSEWSHGVNEGYLDAVEGNGQVGKISLYIPAFVAVRDETLISFFGLGGDRNRQKLAETFDRPINWTVYCEEVSLTNCSSPDTTAQRYPTLEEEGMYYHEDFIGHFRPTSQNNCTAFPDTCNGHIVGPPCKWSTNLDAQLYWNEIALESNGPMEPNGSYSYGNMIQIWRAANATKSNVIFWWFKPDPTVEEFRGTDAEFQQILLPEATEACSKARISALDRCSTDPWVRRGGELGACDSEAHALQKIVATSLRQKSPPAYQSPAYEAIKNLKISDLAMNNILRDWVNGNSEDAWGYGPRKAVCEWVANNLDLLDGFVPPGYPRKLTNDNQYDEPWLYIFYVLGGLSAALVVVVSIMTYHYRAKRVFVVAQPFFLTLILSGFLMTSIAAILYVNEPSKASCGATVWLASLGFTLQLVPLLIKIAAITKIDSHSKKLKRVTIRPKAMIAAVASVVGLVLVYLTVWTIVDPPTRVEDHFLSPDDDTVVEVTEHCGSQSEYWVGVVLGWEALLLVCATVLAVQSRHVVQQLNESKSLGVMVYAHFFFQVVRFFVYFLSEIFQPNVRAAMNSFLWSMDTIVVMAVYFGPKLADAVSTEIRGGGNRSFTNIKNNRYGSDDVMDAFRRAAALESLQLEPDSDTGIANSTNEDSGQPSVTLTSRPFATSDPLSRWGSRDGSGFMLSLQESLEEDDNYSDSGGVADEETQPPAKLGTSDVTESETPQPEEEALQVPTGRSEDDPEQPSSPQAPAKSSLANCPIQDRFETDGHLQQSNRQERGLLDHNSGAFSVDGAMKSPRIRKRVIEAEQRSSFSL
jgi:hypothetical protein